MTLRPPLTAILIFAATAGWSVAASPSADPNPRGLEVFTRSVRPVLIDACVRCHGGAKTKAGLDLTTRDGLLKGGDNGPAVVPGKSADSLLFSRVTHADKPFMPPSGDKLPDAVLTRFAEWIDLGAPYDGPLIDKAHAVRASGAVTDEDRKFWCFAPLQRVSPPKVKDESWCRTPVDRFIRAKLEQAGLRPNSPIDRRRLIRRATFDLLGLPPTPEEIEAFVADPDPAA